MGQRNKDDPKGPRKKRPVPKERPARNEQPPPVADNRHRHCNNCGISVKPDEEYCSAECRTKFEKMIKRKKQLMWLPMIGAILLILFYILVATQGK